MGIISDWQDKVLKILSGSVDSYCLGGGTALSKFYFNHRQSFDLDFFTESYSRKDIISLVEFLSIESGRGFEIVKEQPKKDRIRILVFNAGISPKYSLKIDFIEDYIRRLKPAKQFNGICVFSLEDIYLRKIYAVSGTLESLDQIGRKIRIGGRQEAKDFYDLYFLSHTFMNLSVFAGKYCNQAMQEALINWFRSYPRLEIKSGILELKTENMVDYRAMEAHFKAEIDRILENQIGGV